jgi:uncharacterized protein (DUF1800 family)
MFSGWPLRHHGPPRNHKATRMDPTVPTRSTGSPTEAGAAMAALALATTACGGGGGGEAAAAPAPPPAQAAPTAAEASRFLAQAGLGATDDGIARVQAIGYAGWIDEQFALPQTQSHYDWMVARGYAVEANFNSFAGTDNTLWRKLLSAPDVLRQRVAFALSEIMVVSMAGLPVGWRGFLAAAYMDVLETHAFGRYRTLLEAVTLSPAMGVYLNMRGNQKEDAATGRVPDENYAREVLQLFSLGLVELASDGTLKNGAPSETYGADTITGLARVFTGWDFDAFNRSEPAYVQRPMVLNAARHSTGAKSFLGTTVAAGTEGRAALMQALDAIAAHPNVGPFISRQLIQRLVGSSPTPAYVGRVAAVFADNGSGVRGDLKAVIRAVLLDPEARRAPDSAGTQALAAPGKLREPVLRFVQWARSFKLDSPTGLWNVGNLSDPATRLGQSPLRSPSVFNFFRPGYVPPNSTLGVLGVTAPEFQITNESTVVGWANYAQTFVVSGAGETRPDYTAELALAADAPALVDRVALLLAPQTLSAATRSAISTAVASISAATDAGRRNRVYAAVHLVLCAPEYLVQI